LAADCPFFEILNIDIKIHLSFEFLPYPLKIRINSNFKILRSFPTGALCVSPP